MIPVTDGHEVSKRRSAAHDQYAHQILSAIEDGHPISQRSLSSSLGIALGLTNLLVKRLIRKGWIRVTHIRPNRVGYFLTPTGIAEKARMSHAYFQHSVEFYTAARDRLRARFLLLSERWPVGAAHTEKRLVFLGTGEVAEIAYVCLQGTDLHLCGVIDFQGRDHFFGLPVHPAAAADQTLLDSVDGRAAPALVAFSDSPQLRAWLERVGVSAERVIWIMKESSDGVE